MGYGEYNGHVTDDVTWPRKVKVVTQLTLGPSISKRAGDRGLATISHEQDTEYGESIGHVTDDVTWPRNFKFVTQLSLGLNISKTARDRGLATMGQE